MTQPNPFGQFATPATPVPVPVPVPTNTWLGQQAPAPSPVAPPAAWGQPAAPAQLSDPMAGLGDPVPGGGGGTPPVMAMINSLIILIPHTVETGIPNTRNPGQTQSRLTADCIILAGPTGQDGVQAFAWVDDGTKQQMNKSADEDGVPYVIDPAAGKFIEWKRKFFSQKAIIEACSDALDERKPHITMVHGHLRYNAPKSAQGNGYYTIEPFADRSRAQRYFETLSQFG